MRILRADIIHHLCKKPLADVTSLHLQGRGVEQLEGLGSCPSLTSLDVSYNSLTGLDEECFARCRELWVLDASHNQLESIAGLASFLAIGYLNLSHNNLPLESLRPLARTHFLELYLASDKVCAASNRPPILRMLPNVWVLDGEYVTVKERFIAEGLDQSDGVNNFIYSWNSSTEVRTIGQAALYGDDHKGQQGQGGCSKAKEGQTINAEMLKGYHPEYRDMEQQGRLTREFLEEVVWKLPSRSEAADPVRLRTLLERYDRRVANTNKATWLSSFTTAHSVTTPSSTASVDSCGGHGDLAARRRLEASCLLPLSHCKTLRSLPVEVMLDLAVILAVRVAFRDTIPRQVLDEALLVLLMPQGGVPEGIHDDLSRVPPFVCTALVQALREDILCEVEQVSAPGRQNTMDPPILDRAQTDLLAALPPVITGIGNAWESQETSQTTNAYNNATAVNVGHKSSIITEVSRTREALRSGDRDESNCSSSGGDSMLLMATARTAAEGFSGKKIDVNEVIKPSSALDSGSVNPPDDHTRRMMCTTDNEPSTFVSTTLSSEGDTDNNTEKGYVSDKECVAVTAVRDESVGETPSPVPARTPAELTSSTMMRTGGEVMAVAAETAALPEASVGMSDRKTLGRSRADVSLTRLCRRAVILLTRSPTCPDLVGRQTGVADQRTYDQMEPLLEKAGMSYKDLHPGTMQEISNTSVFDDTDGLKAPNTRRETFDSGRLDGSSAFTELSRFSPCDESHRAGCRGGLTAEGFGTNEEPNVAARCSIQLLRPRVGEMVQILRDKWSVIVAACSVDTSITVAPVQGTQSPRHISWCHLDSRDLCYDPRGWWKHTHALKQQVNVSSATSADQLRLYRPHKGISASGLPSGAGSLNASIHLVEGPADETTLDARCCDGVATRFVPQASSPMSASSIPGKRGFPCGAAFPFPDKLAGSTPPFSKPDHSAGGRRRCVARALDVFTAEGSWDPVFVVAPARLIGLQNQVAARARGLKRARQVAWHRIDGPEVSVAPRPMMPRCWTHPPPPSRKVDRPFVLRSASIPGLGCNHWPALHTDVQTRPAQIQSSRGSPSAQRGLLSNTASGPSGLRSSAEVTKNSGSTDPWKELQREMGSLKAESQRRWCRGGRRGVESLRNVLRAQGLAKTQTTKWTSTHKDSKEGMVAEAKAAANTLSSTLDRPVSSWRRDRGGNAGDGVPDDKSPVFELTQLQATPQSDGDAPSSKAKAGNTVGDAMQTVQARSPIALNVDEALQVGGCSVRGKSQWRGPRQENSSLSSTRPVVWKPNTNSAFEWFPVPGRMVFRVDPSQIAAEVATSPVTVEKTADKPQPGKEEMESEVSRTSGRENQGGSAEREPANGCTEQRAPDHDEQSLRAERGGIAIESNPRAKASSTSMSTSVFSSSLAAQFAMSEVTNTPRTRRSTSTVSLHDSRLRSQNPLELRNLELNWRGIGGSLDYCSNTVQCPFGSEMRMGNERRLGDRPLPIPGLFATAGGTGIALTPVDEPSRHRVRGNCVVAGGRLLNLSSDIEVSTRFRKTAPASRARASTSAPSAKRTATAGSRHTGGSPMTLARWHPVPDTGGTSLFVNQGRLPPFDLGSRSDSNKWRSSISKKRRGIGSGRRSKPYGRSLSGAARRHSRLASPMKANSENPEHRRARQLLPI